MVLVARALFWVYKNILALFVSMGFRSQEVYPLELPIDEEIGLIPFASGKPVAAIPHLYTAARFPKADRARMRSRRIRVTRPLIGLLNLLKTSRIPPISDDHDQMIRAIYPRRFKKAWPTTPVVPPELKAKDVLAELAVAGPFADYVARIRDDQVQRINAIESGHTDTDAFTIDLEELAKHPVKDGLHPIGCTVLFRVDAGRLRTQSIVYRDAVVTKEDDAWPTAEKVALCSLSTHMTIIKHNVYTHLMYVTVHAAVTIDTLSPDHPIRRLIHHCFQTALIGNYEVGQFQIRGKNAYCCTLFSYDYDTMIGVINAYLDAFDMEMMHPMADARRRGVEQAPFAYPFLDNISALWDIIWSYVDEYVDQYFAGDYDVSKDPELEAWYESLDSHVPGGIGRFAGPLEKEAVKKLCAALIHTSTVTHDNLNNIVWNYTTLHQHIPTVVPADGSLPRRDIAFDFLTTIIGTWKKFNMLLDGISHLALDPRGEQIMDGFIDAMKSRQAEMDGEPFRHATVYPRNWNFSISN